MKKYFGLRGSALNWAVGLIAGCDFLFSATPCPIFSPSFQRSTRTPPPQQRTHPTAPLFKASQQPPTTLGCFVGAVITIFIGNPLGRKRMIMLGTSIMIIGAALQASATTLPHLIAGRFITGLGNSSNTSTIPTWQSETSHAHRRGKLVMIEGALISGGLVLDRPGVVLRPWIVFCVFILSLIWGLPESPRWLILRGREDEAREVLAALNDKEVNDKIIVAEFDEVKDTVIEMSKGTFADLFTMDKNRNLHRTLLAYTNQMFQQITGINLVTYYLTVIYSNLGMSQFLSLLLAALNGTEYFLASWPAVFLVERVGRRKLMLFGAVGQAATMAILAGVDSLGSRAGDIAVVVFLLVFNTFFAVGWLGMTWLYPAEIVRLRIRAPANALSTSANWIFNFLVVKITPVAFNNIGYQTYIIFAVINAFMVPSVYFFYPETACRSLEEMDGIFHKLKPGWKGVVGAVHQARVEPRRSKGVMVQHEG
ncbi:general substrate transporter [Cryphonectria parasitica EP155]|uniref:General substrate transporter n=1 Tax=Cryphonectria parasitica (strain ATCC 38755 / EP155) TaxID=660469 RepID=A0A9P5CMS1_CRYP1|nr:general substrate transporter [Cryphonectria parasitica EP155]KAF3763371.1 general substrate transporter [Cryphonectria parasitica EP155]